MRLLAFAYKKHMDIVMEGLKFRACDRHLLGLFCISEEEGLPLPELFTDPSFVKR